MPEFTEQEYRALLQFFASTNLPIAVIDQETFNLVSSLRSKLEAAIATFEVKEESEVEPKPETTLPGDQVENGQ